MVMAVACQSSASASPTPDAAASGAIPSFVGAPDLEATLPDEAGGIVFQSFSMSGPDFVGAEIDDQFVDFINGLGADIDQVAVAVAIGAQCCGQPDREHLRLPGGRLNGLGSDRSVQGQRRGLPARQVGASPAESCGAPLVWTPGTIGGKSVEVAEPNEDFPTPIALYAVEDTLYFVSTTDPAAFEAILAALPPVEE